jgi:hypothetical protein
MGNFLSGEPARLTGSRGTDTADHFTLHFLSRRVRPFLYSGEARYAV